jgi:ATP-dependent DNA helicase RecG
MLLNVHSILHLKWYTLQVSQMLTSVASTTKSPRGRLMLAQRFYTASGKPGTYTRTKGLARPQQKELVVQHLRESGTAGAGFGDFTEMLPGLTRGQIQTMLKELRKDERIHLVGERRFARWYAGPRAGAADDNTSVN